MNRDINFFDVYNHTKQSKTLNNVAVMIVLLLILSVLAIGALYTQLNLQNNNVLEQKAEADQYINNSANNEKVTQINKINSDLSLLSKYANGAKLAESEYKSLPKLSVEIIDKINSCKPSDVEYVSLNFDTDTLVIRCTCVNIDSAPNFVMTLKKLSDFSNIKYEGVTAIFNKTTNQIDGYSFNITCVIKGGDLS